MMVCCRGVKQDSLDHKECRGRRLQFEDFVINSFNAENEAAIGGKTKRGSRKKGAPSSRASRAHVFSMTVDQILVEADRYHMWWTGPSTEPIVPFAPATWGAQHRPDQHAIFTTTLTPDRSGDLVSVRELVVFLGSCRRHFQGDIVIAINTDQLAAPVQAVLRRYGAVVYELPRGLCALEGGGLRMLCGSGEERVPEGVFTHYFYEKWAALYSQVSMVLLTELRDVFFQSDPFDYRVFDWHPEHQLAVYQEAYPHALLASCHRLHGLLVECYGLETVRPWRYRTAVSSGGVLGTRNGVVVLTHFITRVCISVCVRIWIYDVYSSVCMLWRSPTSSHVHVYGYVYGYVCMYG
ncbi:hypothetical protein EON64_15860 [archaeon]|nr:MAG: hypothetical protein EON64_15860 [archaeon]